MDVLPPPVQPRRHRRCDTELIGRAPQVGEGAGNDSGRRVEVMWGVTMKSWMCSGRGASTRCQAPPGMRTGEALYAIGRKDEGAAMVVECSRR